MNRETLVNLLDKAVNRDEDTIINPRLTYVHRDVLQQAAAMLVADKIQMEGLIGRINVLNTELTNPQLREKITALREEITDLTSKVSGLESEIADHG